MKKITLFIIFIIGIQFSQAQDSCLTALSIIAGTYTVDAIDGTEVPSPVCAANGEGATAGEWYTYTTAQTKTVTITTDLQINICKDTRFHVYTGTCGALTCYSGDDDSGVISCNSGNTNSYLSFATFTANAGVTYYIAFDNKWSSLGFDFSLIEEIFVEPLVSFTTTTTPTSSNICAVVDMNGDYLDDVVTVQNNQITLLEQKTTGGFTTYVYPLASTVNIPDWSIAAGDYDRNTYNDLVLGNGSRVTVLKANNDGTDYSVIAYPESIFTQRTNFVDINNDGNLDLWACHDVNQSHPYKNDGNGNLNLDFSFFPTSNEGGNYATIWTDYDNDGDIDMYEAKCRGGAAINDPKRINLLYNNDGQGIFTNVAPLAGVDDHAQSWSTAVEDFDNDGDLDFLLSNISDQNKFFLNNGDGTFTDIYASTGIAAQVGSWELQAADFNNDGWVDFFWQNGKELYINNGDLTFTGMDLDFNEGAIGDLNNDGFLDVQFGNSIHYNVPNANNWITVNLEGIQSNRNGIGARVEIYGAWGKQIREIRSGQGFSHMSSLNAYFGIGTETQITQLIVRWPSGTVDVIDNPTSNRRIMVQEGSAPLANANFKNAEFSLYPNPAKQNLNITANNGITFKTAQIYDLNGKLILKSEIKNSSITVENLKTGTYLLLLKDEKGKGYSQKFIKE